MQREDFKRKACCVFTVIAVAALAGCNKTEQQNEADYRALLAKQEHQLKVIEDQQAHERQIAEIQAQLQRQRDQLQAETDRLKNERDAKAREKVGSVLIIGAVISSIGLFAYLGWRYFIYQVGFTNRVRTAEAERTARCGELIEYLKSPDCDLSEEARQKLIESTVDVSNRPLLLTAS